MGQGTELYIETGIHNLVDIVYGRVYRYVNSDLINCIKNSTIKLEANEVDTKQYLPPFDCLYYPTVSPNKCADDFDENDWNKLEAEISKNIGKILPTFQFYKLHRLNNELRYFLKLALHSSLNPQEGIGTLGFDYFVSHCLFVTNNFPQADLLEEYEKFWCSILNQLKTDTSVKRVGYDGNFYPLGRFAVKQIEWIQTKIGCSKHEVYSPKIG
jgi:hypothetical protein